MNSMIQTQLLKDILENNTLFEVEEIDGKLEYKLDSNGEKIRICEINELEEDPIYQNINDVCLFIGKGKTPKYVDISSIEVIKSGQARGNYDFDFTNKYFMDEDSIDKTDDRILKYGDLVINTTGVGTVGRVTAYIIDEGLYTPDSHMCIMRTKKEVYFKYLLLNFLSIGFKKLESMAEGTGGQIELGIAKIKEIPIYIPKEKEFNDKVYLSYEIQQSIAKNIEEKLQNIDKKISIIEIMMKVLELKIESFLDERINDLSKKKDLISLELTSSNKYFKFTKGSRVTKSKVMSFETIENDIPIYSASKFDEEIFGFSSEAFLTKNGNVIVENPSILINADGSTGITRIKKDGKFALNDVVFAIEVLDKGISLNYIKRMIDNELIKHNLNYANKLYETDLKSKKIEIKIPFDETNVIDYNVINTIDKDVEKIKNSNMYLLNMKETLHIAKEKVLQQMIIGEL